MGEAGNQRTTLKFFFQAFFRRKNNTEIISCQFQRRLRIEGDTELGLYVKNLMDSIDLDTMPALLKNGLLRLADFVEAGLQEGREPQAPVAEPC